VSAHTVREERSMPRRSSCRSLRVLVVAAALLAIRPGASLGATHERTVPVANVGFSLGPGWGQPSRGETRLGYMGSLYLGMSLGRVWACGMDARFYGASHDTIETNLIVAGPSFSWQPWNTGPMVRAVLGVGYDHEIHELATTSQDDRLDGTGVGLSLAYEIRLNEYFALGPQFDYSRLWLGEGQTASYIGVSVELMLHAPRVRQAR
jgi:hypothetical protein